MDTWTGIDANIEPGVEAGTCETGVGKPATAMSGRSQFRRRCCFRATVSKPTLAAMPCPLALVATPAPVSSPDANGRIDAVGRPRDNRGVAHRGVTDQTGRFHYGDGPLADGLRRGRSLYLCPDYSRYLGVVQTGRR